MLIRQDASKTWNKFICGSQLMIEICLVLNLNTVHCIVPNSMPTFKNPWKELLPSIPCTWKPLHTSAKLRRLLRFWGEKHKEKEPQSRTYKAHIFHQLSASKVGVCGVCTWKRILLRVYGKTTRFSAQKLKLGCLYQPNGRTQKAAKRTGENTTEPEHPEHHPHTFLYSCNHECSPSV